MALAGRPSVVALPTRQMAQGSSRRTTRGLRLRRRLASRTSLAGTTLANQSAPGTGSFDVEADSVAPTGGSITYPNGWLTAAASGININFLAGNDAESGLGSWQVERSIGTSALGVCGSYGPFAGVGPASPATSPFNDNVLVDGSCYMYRLVVTDNVGNKTIYASPNEVKVDQTPPTGTISATPVGPASGILAMTGTSFDASSGVSNIVVAYSGPATGVICNAPQAPSTLTAWSCNWNTAVGALPDGLYTITLQVQDVAGNLNAAPITRTIMIDNTAPITTFDSFTEGANPQFQYWSGAGNLH